MIMPFFNMADVVSDVLQKHAKQIEKFKPTKVEKLLELEYDLGALLAIDTNDVDTKNLKSKGREQYLLELARDGAQLLLNKVWELPVKRVDEAVVATLPKLVYRLPREKPLPRPRTLTKWQQFAKEKGIQKRKKSKLTWDDVLKKWVPRHGYKRAAAEKQKDWLLEVPQNADPYEDRFEKKAAMRTEKVAKNEYQRLRNIAAARNIKVPRVGLPPTHRLTASQLETAAKVARVSTASIGKFQARLPKEKDAANGGKEGVRGVVPGIRKRRAPPRRPTEERASNLAIADAVLTKRPKLDVERAVRRHAHVEQEERTSENLLFRNKTKGKGGAGAAKRTKGKGRDKKGKRPSTKPVAGKGKRSIKERGGQTGRKRR